MNDQQEPANVAFNVFRQLLESMEDSFSYSTINNLLSTLSTGAANAYNLVVEKRPVLVDTIDYIRPLAVRPLTYPERRRTPGAFLCVKANTRQWIHQAGTSA